MLRGLAGLSEAVRTDRRRYGALRKRTVRVSGAERFYDRVACHCGVRVRVTVEWEEMAAREYSNGKYRPEDQRGSKSE